MRKHLIGARRDNNISTSQAANALNVTERMYRYIEAGTRGTSETNWLKLYHLFDCKVPLHELMENSKNKAEPIT